VRFFSATALAMIPGTGSRENPMQKRAFLVVCTALCCVLAGTSHAQSTFQSFDWVWQSVDEKFYDPRFNGIDWAAMKSKYRARALSAGSREEHAAIVNEMLAELRTSHTRLYTPDTTEYFQLLGLFLPPNDWLAKKTAAVLTDGKALYSGIGIYTTVVSGEHYVRAVFEGLPAHSAGILLGDRIVSVDGAPFHAIRSFAGKAGKPVTVVVERSVGQRRSIPVVPALLDGTTMFVDAMSASVQVIEQGGRKVGYLHAWSYAGPRYQEILRNELLFGRLKAADALVLDIRDGWGGADPSNLNLFTTRGLTWTARERDGETTAFPSSWAKPVVLLTDGRSNSGKELLAYSFKRGKVGIIVGARTGGAVVAGTILADDNANLLYVATADVTMDDGTRLEGKGVQPDIEVPFELPHAQGRDPQKERAVREAARLAGAG
jgi:carboxyl-terminal processing protease